jgi:hypothetical protein
MADLSVTIGLDQSELEKGLAAAGKSIDKGMGGAKGAKAGANFISDILSGNVGSAIGGLFGPIGSAFGAVIDQVIGKIRELAEYAKELRTIRLKTGLSYSEIEGINAVAKSAGISATAMAESMVEFRKKSADAFIKGGELIRLIPKLGVGLEELRDGSFDYFQAIKLLSEAQKAGTDAATLDYYANALLGSSYKEMLPLIKMGSTNLKLYNESIYKNSTEAVDAMARFGDAFDRWITNLKNRGLELVGGVFKFAEDRRIAKIQEETSRYMNFMRAEADSGKNFKPNPTEAAQFLLKEIGPGFTDEQRTAFAKDAAKNIKNENDRKMFMDEFSKLIEQPGKKLSPFGFTEAGAASQLQQMAGGDIFGAVGFSPLTMIEKNTKETAENTRPKSESSAPVVQPELIK